MKKTIAEIRVEYGPLAKYLANAIDFLTTSYVYLGPKNDYVGL
jgi:hypothetical protein